MAESIEKNSLKVCRAAIRTHRDARGDDRCWLDDYLVWNLIDGTPPPATGTCPFAGGMELCRLFFKFRNASTPDPQPVDAITDPARWDDDLDQMSADELVQELKRAHAAIRLHRDIADRPLTADDDRALYGILPEKMPADFRLPPEDEFLGEAKAPHAGCPAFWRSHGSCPGAHDFHRWGPCGKK